jgi:signal transduction histidine kinase
MNIKKTALSRRIILSFVLLTTVISGLFSLGIVLVVHRVEEQLLSAELNRSLERLLYQSPTEDHMTTLNRETRFYSTTSHPLSHPIPESLRDLESGFHEIIEDQTYYYAMVRKAGNERYILLQDQGDFETREQTFFAVAWIGFIISVVISLVLGRLLARQVIAPVIQLADQVASHKQSDTQISTLARQFANDEIGQLAEKFDESFNQLTSALQREKLFTADISHELRTPLMVISSSCELLQVRPDLSADQLRLIGKIFHASIEMQQISQVCLQLAREQHQSSSIEAGLEKIAFQQIEVWQDKARHKQLQLHCIDDRSHKDGQFVFNQPMLMAVIGNLLRNAVHYTEQGSVVLRLHDRGFSVEDSGPGIPPEQRYEMFLPFRRGSQNFSEGIGLGLSLVQRICLHQGWDISLQERQPHGCCFNVNLMPV